MRLFEKLLLYLLLFPPAVVAAVIDRLFRRRRDRHSAARVLVLQPGNIGDLVLTVPFLRECRKRFPGGWVCLVTSSWNLDFARSFPYVDRVEGFDNPFYVDPGHARRNPNLFRGVRDMLRFVRRLRGRRFDVAFEFRGHANALVPLYLSGAGVKLGYSYRGHGFLLDGSRPLHFLRTDEYEPDRLLRLLDFIVPAGRDSRLEFPIGPRERGAATEILEDAGVDSSTVRVGLVFGAPWAARRWPAERYASLADRLAGRGASIFLLGSAAERDLGERLARSSRARPVNLAGRVGLETLGAVIEGCDLVVANDTGPMHLAAALGKPLVALFGPGELSRWGPRGENQIVIRSPVPCAPCHQQQMDTPCRHPERACMAQIGVDRVMAAVESLWDSALEERRRRLASAFRRA